MNEIWTKLKKRQKIHKKLKGMERVIDRKLRGNMNKK